MITQYLDFCNTTKTTEISPSHNNTQCVHIVLTASYAFTYKN